MRSFLILSFISCFLISCASVKSKRSKDESTQGQNQEEVSGDKEGSDLVEPEFVAPKFGVILGPGLIKAYAHLGVLEVLDQNDIVINEINGIGWGAIPAAGYAKDGKSSALKWQMYKIKKEQYPSKSLFSGGYETKELDSLDSLLRGLLGSTDVSSFKVPFRCPYASGRGFVTGEVERGLARSEIKRCLGGNVFYKDYRDSFADLMQLEEMITGMKKRGIEKILLVNVLSPDDSAASNKLYKSQTDRYFWGKTDRNFDKLGRGVDYYLRVDTRGVDFSGFDKTRDLDRKGKAAIQTLMDQIRKDILGR